MIGPYICAAAIIIGGTAGTLFAKAIPQRLQDGLPAAFALSSVAMGVVLIMKVHNLPAVVLALLFGITIGELCYMEKYTQKGAAAIRVLLAKFMPPKKNRLPDDVYDQQFTALIVLFCAGSTGILGALTEGINGDYQLLLIKAGLDIFTALIFAVTLGPAVMTIAIPLFVIQTSLYYSAKLIMPFMNEATFGDFSACGGILLIAVGFRIAQVKNFAITNFLPALVIIIPCSIYWQRFMT